MSTIIFYLSTNVYVAECSFFHFFSIFKDMLIHQHNSGFLYYDIPEDWLDEAREMRIERDKLYKKMYTEYGSNKRWIGELGEIAFNYWLNENQIRTE